MNEDGNRRGPDLFSLKFCAAHVGPWGLKKSIPLFLYAALALPFVLAFGGLGALLGLPGFVAVTAGSGLGFAVYNALLLAVLGERRGR